MIIKILHGSSLYGVVSYNQRKVDEGTAEVIHTHRMILPWDDSPGSLFSRTLQSFAPYLAANPRVKSPAVHISVNPSPGDVIGADTLARISDDYLQQMGYGGQPYIVYRHRDIDRVHYHIVTVNIDENGARISDRYEKLRSMGISRALEKKYGLAQLTCEHDEESRLYLNKVDYKKGDLRRQVSNTVKAVLDMYGFRSLGEYNALLSVFNIHVKHVRGEEAGNLFNGIVYCATDNKGEEAGNPIKSSRIGKQAGYESLLKKIKKTEGQAKAGKTDPTRNKHLIREAMLHSKGRKQFEEALKPRGIDVVFRENGQGRIYGVTFIDHNLRQAYNGSRLGKEFSANTFHRLFEENTTRETESRGMGIPARDTAMAEPLPYRAPATADEVFGTFSLDNSGYDPEEEAFIRKLRRRKKRGAGRKAT